MKKVLIALSLLAASTSAQECDDYQKKEWATTSTAYTAVDINGHRYIVFEGYHGIAVVHDAGCTNHSPIEGEKDRDSFNIW